MGIITETHNDNVVYVENVVQEDAHEDLILSRTSYQVETEKTHQVATETENQLAADTEQQLSALIAVVQDKHAATAVETTKTDSSEDSHTRLQANTSEESQTTVRENERKESKKGSRKGSRKGSGKGSRKGSRKGRKHGKVKEQTQREEVVVSELVHSEFVRKDDFTQQLKEEASEIITHHVTERTPTVEPDQDECDLNLDECSHICVNTIGSYECQCYNGFLLAEDGFNCYDEDECLNSPCGQVCTNTPGSYVCSCREGYNLDHTGHLCYDVDECRYRNGDCPQVCVNTLGSHHCACEDGFTLMADGISCTDVDECRYRNGDCPQVCVNTWAPIIVLVKTVSP